MRCKACGSEDIVHDPNPEEALEGVSEPSLVFACDHEDGWPCSLCGGTGLVVVLGWEESEP